jgi:hypothetical protein
MWGAEMVFEELDDKTRSFMVEEFDAERRGPRPYRPPELPEEAWESLQQMVREAIQRGTMEDLAAGVRNAAGEGRFHQVRDRRLLETFARFEFCTWYVRGLSRRLLEEGVEFALVAHGEEGRQRTGRCGLFQGQLVSVRVVYEGHRARYWPPPGNPFALTVPADPTCRHTIRRL